MMTEETEENNGQNRISKNQLRLMKFNGRVARWANEVTQNNNMVNALKKGLHNGISVSKHKFREIDPSKHRGNKPFYGSRKYMKEKEKIMKAEKEIRESFLEKPRFDERKERLRENKRYRDKEVGSSIQYRVKTEAERIDEEIKPQKLKDFTIVDNKMNHFPNWRSDNERSYRMRLRKNKSLKKFYNQKNIFKRNSSSWKRFGIYLENNGKQVKDEYVDGLYSYGNKLTSRERDPSKEVNLA